MCTVSADELIVERWLGSPDTACGAYVLDSTWGGPGFIQVYDDRRGKRGSMVLEPDLALGLLQFLQLNEERLREAVQDAD